MWTTVTITHYVTTLLARGPVHVILDTTEMEELALVSTKHFLEKQRVVKTGKENDYRASLTS